MLSLTLLATLVGAALASPQLVPHGLEKRATTACNKDNLYRCFTASSSQAAPYCAAFVAPATVTASTTVTPTSTVTNTVTVTNQVSNTAISTSTSTTTVVVLTTISNTAVVTQTTTVVNTVNNKKLRRATTAAPAGPACLTKDGSTSTSYPASRISSACSCLYSRSTVTVTPTAPASTVTAVATAQQTVTTTVTVTAVVGATATSQSSVTEVATATTVLTVTSTTTNAPACATAFTRAAVSNDNTPFLMQDNTFIYGPPLITTTYPDDEQGCRNDCITYGCTYLTFSPVYGYCELVADGSACQGSSTDFVSGKKLPKL